MEVTKITYKIKKMRVGEEQRIIPARLYPVFTENGEELYYVSADRKDLRMDIQTFLHGASRRPSRKAPRIPEVSLERNNYVRTRIACNVPDFHDQVETLIFNRTGCHKDELFAFYAEFLLSLFPNLKTVCSHDTVTIENASSALRVLDPFAVGEYSFELAKNKDFKEANRYVRVLWALSGKWAKFWREVARDFNRKPEDHPKFDPQGVMTHDGMDDLFRVYLLGWYSPFPIEEEEKIYVEKHKNFQKAIELLPIRFQNCSLHEVSEKLYWDLQYVEDAKYPDSPDFNSFFKVLVETELLFPGAAEGIYKDGWIDYDNYDQLCEHLWSMGDEMTAETIRKMIDSEADAESVEAYLNRMSAVSWDAADVLYELYKNGHVDTMIAVQDFILDFPELKNEEKAAEHAKKCNIKHNI